MQKLLTTIIFICISALYANAQFSGVGGFGGTNGPNNQQNTSATDTLFAKEDQYTLKRYFKSLNHKDTMSIGWMWGGSVILPGTAQIYNNDYWKLPIIYGGIGGLIGGGWYNNVRFQKTGNEDFARNRNLFFIGAAVMYWASMMDGVICFKSQRKYLPGRAALYSALFPGLGQMYNGEYWKLPIYYGGLAVSGYMWYYNNMQYSRFKTQYNQATTPNGNYTGSLSPDNLKYYRDTYRRYRDYSILATVVIYALQIIDADVFATMKDFDVTDDLTFNVTPAVIAPITTPANFNYNYTYVPVTNSYGIKLNITF